MFEPNNDVLNRICSLIQQANSGTAAARTALIEFEAMYAQQDFFTYLAFIFRYLEGDDNTQLRLYAGWALKRCVRPGGPCDPRNAILQSGALQSLGDSNPDMRRCASSILTTVVESGGLGCWGGDEPLFATLCAALSGQGGNLFLDGVLRTVVKLCEDHYEVLDAEAFGYPSSYVLPALIGCLGNAAATPLALDGVVAVMHAAALQEGSSTHAIVRERSEEILGVVVGLVGATQTEDVEVRKNLCRLFVLLLRYDTPALEANLPQICTYMLQSTTDRDAGIAIEACEIWSALVQESEGNRTLGDVLYLTLAPLLPALLDSMVYSAEEIGMLQSEPDDWRVPDPCDMRREKGDEEDEESDEGSGDEGGTVSQWTLRKCAAIALDDLAELFGDEILAAVLGEVDGRMRAGTPWGVMEGAVLALGAIAEGCIAGMRSHLPSLIPRLVAIAEDASSHTLLRTISFWTLSRYASYVVEAEPHNLVFAYKSITTHMYSDSKAVQEASVSALVIFLDASRPADITPLLPQLVPAMQSAYAKFQIKNTRILFDAVISLCRKMNRELIPFAGYIIEPLQQKWSTTPNDSTFLCGIFVALAAVVNAIGADGALAAQIMDRCYCVLRENLRARKASVDVGEEPPSAEYITTTLDLLSAVVVHTEAPPHHDFISMLKDFASDPFSGDIRQSGLGCIGDLCTTFPQYLGADPRDVHDFMQLCLSNLDGKFASAMANAAWCVGEIATSQAPEVLAPCVEANATALVRILCQHKSSKNVLDNCALSLGKLSAKAPGQFAPHLSTFLRPFCVRIRGVANSPEKESAMVGIICATSLNPEPVVDMLSFFIDVIASFGTDVSDTTFQLFRETLKSFKENRTHAWEVTMTGIPPRVPKFLSERYGC